MSSKRKTKKMMLLLVLAAFLLCTASFLLGVYIGSKADTEDKHSLTEKDDTFTDTVNSAEDSAGALDNTDTAASNSSDENQGTTAGTADTSTTSNSETAGASEETTDNSGSQISASPTPDNDSIVYTDPDYGFTISLPASWQGFTVLTEDWQGIALEGEQQGQVVETGPILIIRHPDWTVDSPRQDIPIMVYTPEQWKKVENEEISVSAAPVIPTKLSSNSDYVFALPARYNYAFQTGYEEVDQIIQDNFFK